MSKKDVENMSPEEILKEIYECCEKTKRYILWGRIMTAFQILLIVVPIILAVLYLPPYLDSLFAPYKSLLNGGEGQNLLQGNSLEQLLDLYK